MTEDGLPADDARLCQRCGRWLDASEGDLALTPGVAARTYRRATGGSPYAFQCRRCTLVRRWRERGLWIALALVGGGVLLLERLGLLPR